MYTLAESATATSDLTNLIWPLHETIIHNLPITLKKDIPPDITTKCLEHMRACLAHLPQTNDIVKEIDNNNVRATGDAFSSTHLMSSDEMHGRLICFSTEYGLNVKTDILENTDTVRSVCIKGKTPAGNTFVIVFQVVHDKTITAEYYYRYTIYIRRI